MTTFWTIASANGTVHVCDAGGGNRHWERDPHSARVFRFATQSQAETMRILLDVKSGHVALHKAKLAPKRGDKALIQTLYLAAERDVEKLRSALRRLAVSAEWFLSRPTDDVAFAEGVRRVAASALADECDCDNLPDDGDVPGSFFNGPRTDKIIGDALVRIALRKLYDAAHGDPDDMEAALRFSEPLLSK